MSLGRDAEIRVVLGVFCAAKIWMSAWAGRNRAAGNWGGQVEFSLRPFCQAAREVKAGRLTCLQAEAGGRSARVCSLGRFQLGDDKSDFADGAGPGV